MKNALDSFNGRGSLRSPFEEFDELFDRAFRNSWAAPWAAMRPGRTAERDLFEARADVEETDSAYLVTVDLPGVRQEDVKVEVIGDALTISGQRKREDRNDAGGTRRVERSYGGFERSFSLPPSTDASKIEAHLEHGVLRVAIPKAEATKPRSIEVQSGRGGFFSKLIGGDRKDPSESPSSDRH